MPQPAPWRVDLLFSYWILFWVALYITGSVDTSPKFALVAAIALSMTTMMLMGATTRRDLTAYLLLAHAVTKLIPLMIIHCIDSKPMNPIPALALFVVYIVYVRILNRRSVLELYGLVKDKPAFTPFAKTARSLLSTLTRTK